MPEIIAENELLKPKEVEVNKFNATGCYAYPPEYVAQYDFSIISNEVERLQKENTELKLKNIRLRKKAQAK
jgi:cell division septum initiation protein DivIVA